MEIERLIGRSLRSVVDLNRLGEYTITLDKKKKEKNLAGRLA